jgi:hypothetical protein
MRITRGIAPTIIVAGVGAVGFASPAWADDVSGTYTIDYGRGNTATWTVTPCDGESFIPCARVAESGAPLAPWSAQAALSVGSWTLFVDRPDAIPCNDGSNHAGRATYSWNAVTLSGSVSVYDDKVCGDEAHTLYAPFTLTKTAPLAGAESPLLGAESPLVAESPLAGAEAPLPGPEVPLAGVEAPVAGAEAPVAGAESPLAAESPVAGAES